MELKSRSSSRVVVVVVVMVVIVEEEEDCGRWPFCVEGCPRAPTHPNFWMKS